MKKGKKLIKQIGRMTGKRLYTVHYTLLGKLVYHLCKMETKQLKNMMDNVINLSKAKRKTKEKPKAKLPRLKDTFEYEGVKRGKTVFRKKKRKFSAKQLKAQRLFAKRAKAGTLRRRR